MNEEGILSTRNNRIFKGKPIEMDYEIFEERINELDEAVWEEIADVRKLVRKIVPGYKYQDYFMLKTGIQVNFGCLFQGDKTQKEGDRNGIKIYVYYE